MEDIKIVVLTLLLRGFVAFIMHLSIMFSGNPKLRKWYLIFSKPLYRFSSLLLYLMVCFTLGDEKNDVTWCERSL